MVTHYSKGSESFSDVAIANQAQYAERYGYSHDVFEGHISGDAFLDTNSGDIHSVKGGGLFWQKYAAIQELLQKRVISGNRAENRCDWVLWMDSDAIVTNQTKSLPEIIEIALRNSDGIYEDKDIILASEETHLLNSGVIFVRNTVSGNAFINAAAATYPLFKDADLPDQIAISNLVFLAEPYSSHSAGSELKTRVHPRAAVVRQRLFNAFTNGTSEEVKWQVGDFIAHLAGTARDQRADIMRAALAESAAHGLL
ncbi:MAG: hypothetical protein EOO38_32310 [Cytophagaceae bacterium]|nr:MAG: hypothetical protein EOO38_32310 [Cytophagaceae bacterium]